MERRWVGVVMAAMLLIGFIVPVSASADITFPIYFDLDNPAHRALIIQPYPQGFTVKPDRFGDSALFFPRPLSEEDQSPPVGTRSMRYALFDFPGIDTFELSVEQIGEGGASSNPSANGGNRSLAVVFGWQDLLNYWVVYYTYTDTVSVRRIVNGNTTYICRPGAVDQWIPNNERYQSASVKLTREGDSMVLNVLANGKPIALDGCRFPAAGYKPGFVGLGGHGSSTVQSWYFKNLYLNVF